MDAERRIETHGNFVDGAQIEAGSGALIDVRNPATGEVIARIPESGPVDVDRAMRSARTAFESKEWGGMGQNYLKSLLALGFQAFLILVCVGIYAVLIQTIAATDDISGAIWSCMGYTVLLCFTLFKTGSLAKSVFSAH